MLALWQKKEKKSILFPLSQLKNRTHLVTGPAFRLFWGCRKGRKKFLTSSSSLKEREKRGEGEKMRCVPCEHAFASLCVRERWSSCYGQRMQATQSSSLWNIAFVCLFVSKKGERRAHDAEGAFVVSVFWMEQV